MSGQIKIFTIALAIVASIASAQQPTKKETPSTTRKEIPGVEKKETPKPKPATTEDELQKSSFEALLRERDSLTKEITNLESEVFWATDAAGKAADLKGTKDEQKIKEITDKLNESMRAANIAPGTSVDDLGNQLAAKNAQIEEKTAWISRIDAELDRRANVVGPQQHFKLEMSIIFSLLVAIVIVCFFYIAGHDERVRQQIFSGQAGIQFVTLFSLVIAIILFGIIDILEGKELAALLGGLSGYILGRSTSVARGPAAAEAKRPAATAGVAG